MKHIKWIFNSQMIWGAVLGSLIFSGVGQIYDAWYYKGPGNIINYEEPQRTRKVQEKEYKRHTYANGVGMLCIGLFLWIVIAKSIKDSNDRTFKYKL